MKKICNIFNAPSHYRKSIYLAMDRSYDCTFVFGDDFPSVKRFDTSILKKCALLHYRNIGRITLLPGMLNYAFMAYDSYLITPSTNNVTMWLFLLLVKIMPQKKVYVWTHGMYGNENKRQLIFKKLLYKLCDGEFVYGDYAIRLMCENGFDKKRLFPIHNSLDYDAQLQLRQSELKSNIFVNHFKNDHIVLISIGRLNKRKQLDVLLDAVNILNCQNVECNIVIVGDGEEYDSLKQKAIDLKIEKKLWLYGPCFDEKTNAELLYNSDLCVIPGDVGLTAIHSMMFGLPVVTHDFFPSQGPEFEVIKNGVTGAFYKQGDTDSLVRVIYDWIKTYKEDYNKREDIRRSCYSIIDKEWNPHYQLSIFNNVFR